MSRSTDASVFVQTAYTLRAVWVDLWQRKFGTLLTILVIAVSLTIPTVSYLMWKNLHLATTQFYPESELTIYLHKNLSEENANLVVEKIRQQKGVESLNYVSRQESLKEFKSWSGFGRRIRNFR
ncbi:ABC transporter permease [Haemophilus influenzae]|uniref:ABC transporter permease n=1 Tax=Haemophilus influenzae TaxID=727 RepID=A0A2X1PLZ0_HAEIF|nr:ABC transporter permease [Haemophilus influenzae]